MTKPKSNSIEYLYIWKKINKVISSEENELLSAWLNESPEHMQFYLDANNFDSKKSVDNTPIAWQELTQKLKQRRRKRILLYSLAASVALLVGFSISSIFFSYEAEQQAEVQLAPEPGVNKATLILSDGSSHVLDEDTNLHLEEDGASIEGKQGKLVYSKQNKKNLRTTYNTIHVPSGGEFSLYLSDSTKVWINAESMLRYPTSFTEKERRVELIGEAYFEVKKDKSKPFVVVSNQQIIEVTGTAFNVSTFGKEGTIVTTLVEGGVQISSSENNELITKLVPGNQSVFDPQSQMMMVKDVNVVLYTSWKDGCYFFQNESLESMMQTLSRWYDFDYQFETDDVRSIRFSGKLKRSDSFQRLLAIMEKTNELNFTINGNLVIIN